MVTTASASVVAKLPVPEPVTAPVRVMVWSPVLVPLTVALSLALKVFPSAMVKVADVLGVVIATLLTLIAVATPIAGVTRVGLVSMTNLVPVPVCEAIEVEFPVLVMGPVKFALVALAVEMALVTN